MRTTYQDRVVANYKDNFAKAQASLNETISTISTTLKKILDENSFEAEQETKWNNLINTLNEKSSELNKEIENKYKEMEDAANVFDEIYNSIPNTENIIPESSISLNHLNSTQYDCIDKGEDSDGYPTVTIKKISRHYKEDDNKRFIVDSKNETQKTFSIKNNDDLTSLKNKNVTF